MLPAAGFLAPPLAVTQHQQCILTRRHGLSAEI